ncbi:hypothetical protein H0H81_005055, partial [Sphagnurus paluster]
MSVPAKTALSPVEALPPPIPASPFPSRSNPTTVKPTLSPLSTASSITTPTSAASVAARNREASSLAPVFVCHPPPAATSAVPVPDELVKSTATDLASTFVSHAPPFSAVPLRMPTASSEANAAIPIMAPSPAAPATSIATGATRPASFIVPMPPSPAARHADEPIEL